MTHIIRKANTATNLILTDEELADIKAHGLEYEYRGILCKGNCDTDCQFYRQGNCPCERLRDMFGEVLYYFPHGTTPPAYLIGE